MGLGSRVHGPRVGEEGEKEEGREFTNRSLLKLKKERAILQGHCCGLLSRERTEAPTRSSIIFQKIV